MNILFRVEATKELGLGHLTRCLVLAEKFSELYNDADILFISASNSVEKTAISHGFKVICLPLTDINTDEIKYYESKLSDSICVTDIPNIPENYLKALKMNDCLVVSLDDESYTMFCSDILIKPNLNPNISHSYSSETQYYGGPKYVILKRELGMYAEKTKCVNECPESVFVCFGGSDHNNVTQKVVNVVKKINSNFTVIIGLLYSYQDELLDSIKGLDNVDVKKDVSDIGELIYNADLAIISGGTLLYETAALGTPSIVICQNHDQNDESNFFAENNAAINLGLFDRITENVIKNTILELISDCNTRTFLSKNAKKLIDTNGADRIVQMILKEFLKR
jgi:spore coat polysaccharide biosynthesis predicted glycosyltransferase SpsG